MRQIGLSRFLERMGMRKRYAINDDGMLVDREGVILGRICGITLDVPVESPLYGGEGGAALEESPKATATAEPQTSLSLESSRQDGGVGETKSRAAVEAESIERVWAHWLAVRPDSRAKNDWTPGQKRLLLKAVREAPVERCCAAIDGMIEWATRKGGAVNLSRAFKTRPGGDTLADQISWWASQSSSSGGSGFITSEVAAEILKAKTAVRQYAPFQRNDHAQAHASRAIATLAEHNIETMIEHIALMGGGAQTLIHFSDEDGSQIR